MKKYAIVAVILVLTVSMLTGCGCTAQDSGRETMPSILPTNIPETTLPTEAQTEPMTLPATMPTDATDGAITDETGDATGETQDGDTAETGEMSRSRMR